MQQLPSRLYAPFWRICSMAVEALAVLRCEVLRRDRHDGDGPPGVLLAQRLEEPEPVHLRHHQVQRMSSGWLSAIRSNATRPLVASVLRSL